MAPALYLFAPGDVAWLIPPELAHLLKRIAPIWITLAFFGTILGFAAFEAELSLDVPLQWPTRVDRVELIPDGFLTGKVMMVIDRGTVLRDEDSRTIRFIPKEQVRRIVFGAAKSTTP